MTVGMTVVLAGSVEKDNLLECISIFHKSQMLSDQDWALFHSQVMKSAEQNWPLTQEEELDFFEIEAKSKIFYKKKLSFFNCIACNDLILFYQRHTI